jgi:competence protein ComEA
VIGNPPVVADTTPAGPVNVNSATEDQLDVLPGVGPTTAAAIVAHREQHGPFQTIDQLGDVRGIGPAKLDALRALVTV